MTPVHAPTRVLVVCTGNICRSPMAEALLARRFVDSGVLATVTSAGLLYEGRSASDGARTAARALGLDIDGHRSSTLDRDTIATADLVIAMEPRHVREVVALFDPAWTKTFTLRELARRAERAGARAAAESIEDWLVRIGEGRRRIDLLDDDDALSVLDPYHQSQAVYDATAADLAAEIDRVVSQGWPAAIFATVECGSRAGGTGLDAAQVRRAG